jgi:hypothetical protein
VAGVCLICGCLSIYYSGDKPYSREAVAETFKHIAIPVFVAIFFTVCSIILEFFIPQKQNRHLPKKDYKSIITLVSAKKDLDNCDESLICNIGKERKCRQKRGMIRALIVCLSSIVFLTYALNTNNFHQSEINESMIKAMLVLSPCLAISFAYSVYTAFSNEKSFQRELDLIKKAPASNDPAINELPANKSDKVETIVKVVILLASIAVIVYGLLTGGTADVLTKAINICTECIGLG